MSISFGGKENDLRMELFNIIQIVYSTCIIASTMSKVEQKYSDATWIRKYPDAKEIYRIYGDSPTCYVQRIKIK